MSRIWMARGIAAGVIAFVVGAWAVGLAIGKDRPANDRETGPASPETSLAPNEEPSVMGEVEDRPRPGDSPSGSPTDGVVPVAETDDPDDADDADNSETDEPADEDPRTPKPSPKPSTSPKPSPSDKPTRTPSPSPSPTGPDCRDLSEVVDCVLAPITTKP